MRSAFSFGDGNFLAVSSLSFTLILQGVHSYFWFIADFGGELYISSRNRTNPRWFIARNVSLSMSFHERNRSFFFVGDSLSPSAAHWLPFFCRGRGRPPAKTAAFSPLLSFAGSRSWRFSLFFRARCSPFPSLARKMRRCFFSLLCPLFTFGDTSLFLSCRRVPSPFFAGGRRVVQAFSPFPFP